MDSFQQELKHKERLPERLESTLNVVDFPTFGSPTKPILREFVGLPSKTLGASSPFFFGGILDIYESNSIICDRVFFFWGFGFAIVYTDVAHY